MRSTLDGHIVLSRHIADQARYPAVDVLGSVSRLAHCVWDPAEREPVRLREKGLLIAEGRFVVRRLLHSKFIRLRSLLLNDAALAGLGDILDRAFG